MKKLLIYCRAMRLSRLGKDAYNAAVYSCANLSRLDHNLAFQVYKTGPFGFPVIEQIPRQALAICVEDVPHVVVKDGIIYELQTKDEINKKIASCKALQGMTVEEVIGSDRFRDNLAAYMTEQRETRNMAIRSYQAMHKLGGPKGYRLPAHPVDRLINMPVGEFRAEFMEVIGKQSARPRAEREYIRQLGQQAYNLTVAQFVVEEFPELSEILIPKSSAN